MNHQELYDEARRHITDWYGGESFMASGACLYWTQAAMTALSKRGRRACLQAGSLHWRIVPESEDDGVSPTHFAYEWSPRSQISSSAIARCQLPEVHIWAGLPDTNEIVDFSTGYLKKIAEDSLGLKWRTADPPQFVFGKPPDDAIYHPNRESTLFVFNFIMEKMTAAA